MVAKKRDNFVEDEALRQDIEAFFQPRVHDYLNKQIKRLKQIKRPFSPSHAMNIIKAFEQEIDHLELPEQPDNEYKATLDLWKKTFTRNILVPEYLLHDPHIELEHVLNMIKRVLHSACQEVKTEAYVSSFKQTIVNSLRNIPPLERMRRARQILSSSVKVLQKLEKNFSKDLFLASFPKNKLQELVDEAAMPLLPQEPLTSISPPLPRRIRPSLPKSSGIDLEKLKTYLRSHLIPEIAPEIKKANTLLAKLQVVSTLFSTLEKQKERLTTWLRAWTDKPAVKEDVLLTAAWQQLPELIKQIRAEVLAHNCHDEIMAKRENSSFLNFAKEREDIIERYIRFYLQEQTLKDFFLDALHEEERAQRDRFLPPLETAAPPSPKAPGSKSLWQKV